MARGKTSQDGDTFTNQNGYHHTRVNGKWMATHRLVAEKKLGRALGRDEYTSFVDGNKENLSPDNIVVKKRGQASDRQRYNSLVARVTDLYDELHELAIELGEEPPRFPRT